ncbi:CGP-CTERM sorting domain-containing protein [Thermococcus profundus]|uniref:CGP-CTERM sorting domain-containing protein n=1 Tax=Thermococcus profundus TaxID=49899 RepID=UPI0018DFFFC3|nr:CGP-CTERM sorting domain-containing protein [Thermococcus profundus]
MKNSEDGQFNAVAVASNGDIVIIGRTGSSGASNEDFLVLRLDENGNANWGRTYGGRGYDWAYSVDVAPNGDIIVVGDTSSFGAGYDDAWVLRLDKDGNVIWGKAFGGSNPDVALAVAVAPNDDVIVAGYTYSFGSGQNDVWVIRLDKNGKIEWQKTYGGSGGEAVLAVAISSNGDIILAGNTGSFGAGRSDAWVLKLDKDGTLKWGKAYGGEEWDEASAVAIAPNGDIIVAGDTEGFGAGGRDFWLLRLDGNGNVKWQKTYGGSEDDYAHAVVLTPGGDILVAGDSYLLALDTNGNLKWARAMYTTSVKIREDGTAVFAGGPYVGLINVSRVPQYSGWNWDEEASVEVHDSNAKVSGTNPEVEDSNAQIHDTDAEIYNVTPKFETAWGCTSASTSTAPSQTRTTQPTQTEAPTKSSPHTQQTTTESQTGFHPSSQPSSKPTTSTSETSNGFSFNVTCGPGLIVFLPLLPLLWRKRKM